VKFATLLVLSGAAAACTKSGAPETPPTPRVGVFRFTERPAQTSLTIEGSVFVTHDSVVVDATPGPCRYDSQLSHATGPIVYRCADVTFWFDRYDPVGRATYHTSTLVTEHHTVCVRYTADASGHQVCAQSETQTSERQVSVNGTLHMETVSRPD
jgi:hypothetical protein